MLITESQINYGRSIDAMRLLDSMYYLSEEESVYSPAMVPVVENTQVGANLIRLEDLISFGESNGINDLGYALQLVCESSNVNPGSIALTVNEESLYGDQYLVDIARSIINEGIKIAAVPTNPNDPACLAVDIAMNSLLETGNDTLLACIAYGDYSTFLREAEEESKEKYYNNSDSPDMSNADYQYERANQNAEYMHKKRAKDRENMEGTLSKIWDKIKSGANIARDWIAKQLGKLNKWMNNIREKYANMPENKRGWLDKLKNKVAEVIEILTRKLHNIVQANRGNLSKVDYSNYDNSVNMYGDVDARNEVDKNWGNK